MAASRITELASTIATSTATLDNHLREQGLPSPSFQPDTSPELLNDKNIFPLRQAILEATSELHALMLGPVGILTTPAHNFLISLQAICRFNLTTCIPEGHRDASFEEISRRTELNEPTVRRIMRHAMSYHVFQEPRRGVVAHTAASKMLSTNPLLRHWVGLVSEEMWPAACRTVDALARWPDSEEPNHSGFNIAHHTNATVFEELARDPARANRYAEAMTWYSTRPGLEAAHVVINYPWGDIGVGTVVDIGGSHGSISIAIARQFPSITCIVQDRPEVVADARAKLPQELTNRVIFMEHDFFSPKVINSGT